MSKIVCWWSGGITSAVACKLAIDLYGKDKCQIVFIDTQNEHKDTYRFMMDCQKWYQIPIGSITGIGGEYKSIEDVWIKYKSLNVSYGAICSSELKRRVREKWEKEIDYKHQVFGFDFTEFKRAKSLKLNHSHTKPLFPLLMYGYTKDDCIEIVKKNGIDIPKMYELGFNNNNCFGKSETSIGGCVQGGIGYWQKIKKDYPEKFDKMAAMEHKLTNLKGSPVTMLKDQSKNGGLVFLKKHKDYPYIKEISQMKGREPRPLVDCNGFCGVTDLELRNPTEKEINFQTEINFKQ